MNNWELSNNQIRKFNTVTQETPKANKEEKNKVFESTRKQQQNALHT